MPGMKLLCLVAALAASLAAGERSVDPTFLHRYIPAVAPTPSDVSTATCGYQALFGAGDDGSRIVRGVARFGEITVAPGGQCALVTYPAEEQVYLILVGQGRLLYGEETEPVKKNDFMYLAPGVAHSVENSPKSVIRLLVMGFHVPPETGTPAKLQIANMEDVKLQTVNGHPDSVLYRLLVGGVNSKRDRIAAGRVLTSLFLMEFQPGGTNFPHHHDAEEEIYVLLDGSGEMVAGGGMDGIEGRYPAKPGDAYFFRLNCTVGFYNGKQGVSHILAVRSRYPGAHTD